MTLPTRNRHLLSAMVATPERVCFDAQRENEQILLLLRDHVVTLVPMITSVALLIIAPIFGLPFLTVIFPTMFDYINPLFVTLFVVFWYVVLFYYAFEKFLIWFYGVYIVTNQRVVDIDFYGFLQKNYAEAHLSKIQDVSSNQSGPLQVMFDYGYVYVQTAGELANIEFENVPYPDKVGKFVGQLAVDQGANVKSVK